MKKKNIAGLEPHILADKLFRIREEISAFRESLKPLEDKEEALRADMLTALKEQRLDSFRDEDVPLTFVRTYRSSVGITEGKETEALKWALEHNCAKVDTIKAASTLRGAGALPVGFEQKETESLQIRTITDK